MSKNNETQESIIAFAKIHYPDETSVDALKGLCEEVAELAIATGLISMDDMMAEIKKSWTALDHLPKSHEHIESGIADVQIALYALSHHLSLSAQECLDKKMLKNRSSKSAIKQ